MFWGRGSQTEARIQKEAIIQEVSANTKLSEKTVTKVMDDIFEVIVQHNKAGRTVTLKNIGSFYAALGKDDAIVFKFNPSQRWRKALGWTSSYKGDV